MTVKTSAAPIPTVEEVKSAWLDSDYFSTQDIKRELTGRILWKFVPAPERKRLDAMNRIELRAELMGTLFPGVDWIAILPDYASTIMEW